MDGCRLFRPGLLRGLDVVLFPAGAAGGEDPLRRLLGDLGADLLPLACDPLDEDAATAAAEQLGRGTVLACDSGALMRAAGAGGDDSEGLRAAVEGSWTVTRAIVNAVFAPAGFGKALLLAPRPADGPDAAAAGAALENLSRTTGVEWARLGIRVVAVRPRDVTSATSLAQCVAYLASPAGDYFSGCVLDLGAAGLDGSII